MFTGIIESVGTVLAVEEKGTNISLTIASDISHELKVDQSLAHDGVCLTVEKVQGDKHSVTAVRETIQKSNLGQLTAGNQVNLERSLKPTARLDGHIVQGHVDTVAEITDIQPEDGSWLFDFKLQSGQGHLLIEKGSICINGVSLTVFNVTDNSFTVTIIPYTFEHTTFGQLAKHDRVNIEFDVLGKYVARLMQHYQK